LTFAGGEPTLYPRLSELFAIAKREGALVNLVTNGSRIDHDWLVRQAKFLDFLTLSADSADSATMSALGRADASGHALPASHYIDLAKAARHNGIGVKLNTVVTTLNSSAHMVEFVRALAPSRWKILQAMPVDGQNDSQIARLTPDLVDFQAFVRHHEGRLLDSGIRLVPESIDTIRGSYVMVDPRGRFFDSTTGRHRYSSPILGVGLDVAWSQVSFDKDKFLARGGDADFASPYLQPSIMT
jgi:radical S-adenosyl methionine domain-containing protein 2